MTSPSTISLATRTCQQCFRVLPASEFRLRRKGTADHQPQCRLCHNQAERLRVGKIRAQQTQKRLTKAVNRLRNDPSDKQVRAICEQMLRAFGGVDRFVEAWYRCWQTDAAKGRAKTFAHIAAVVRLMQWVDSNRPNYGHLTDEELLDLLYQQSAG